MKTSPSGPRLDRRAFLGQASCAAVGSTALFSTLLSLRLANSLAAQTATGTGDYKALVCLFLAGGNDSYNMLIPTTAGEYEAYAKVRGPIAHASADVLSVTPGNLGGRTLGIHPGMPEVRDLFNAGRLAFVANVGSLLRPLTLSEYKSGLKLPLSLYSHADQVKQWQTCIPDQRTAVGWGGRAADIINSLNTPSLVSMNISLAGQNVFLSGQNVFTYTIGNSGATALAGYDSAAAKNLTALRTAAVDGMLANNYRSLFEQTYAHTTRDSIDAYRTFAAALNGVSLATPVPAGNALAANLAMVAKTASAHEKLGARRQIFFVQLGGWDHHDDVMAKQAAMLPQVSQALSLFWSALGEYGLQNNVTLFTASDFARTLTTDGTGSDHAWGGNHMVLGGAVQGGKVYGSADLGYYPDFRNLAAIDTGLGRLIPGVAVDEYARDLLSWFGVSAANLDYVLPAFSARFGGRPELGLFTPASTGTGGGTGGTGGGGTGGSGGSSSGGGGGGGGAVSGWALGALGALSLARWRRRRMDAADRKP
jgi:uncharacterized protein (DUF1501 family)